MVYTYQGHKADKLETKKSEDKQQNSTKKTKDNPAYVSQLKNPADFTYLKFPIQEKSVLTPVIQAKLDIEGKNYPPFGKDTRTLYDEYIVPKLQELGFKTYGILTQFQVYIRNSDHAFISKDAFFNNFLEYLNNATRTVKGMDVPVLKKFRVSGMSRPAWPKTYMGILKEKLSEAAEGQRVNIRHVVRNATIKTSLDVYYQYCEAQNPGSGLTQIAYLANRLGINVDENNLQKAVTDLYHKLYLNLDNLWLGEATMNQVIGYLADPVYQYGTNILEGKCVFTEQEFLSFIIAKTNGIGGGIEHKLPILQDIFNFASDFVAVNKDVEEVGSFFQDLGLNFGFDFIDDESENTAQRQERLIDVETRLEDYINSSGQRGDLEAIYREFLGNN